MRYFISDTRLCNAHADSTSQQAMQTRLRDLCGNFGQVVCAVIFLTGVLRLIELSGSTN